MQMGFNGTEFSYNGTTVPSAATAYSDLEINGYTVSGQMYTGETCFGTTCTDNIVYSGDSVSSNNWLLN